MEYIFITKKETTLIHYVLIHSVRNYQLKYITLNGIYIIFQLLLQYSQKSVCIELLPSKIMNVELAVDVIMKIHIFICYNINTNYVSL